MQYNSLESTSQVQLQVHKQTRAKLEECNAYIRKLQSQVNELKCANETANQKAMNAEEQKEQIQELVEENRMLEEKLSKLCDLPFMQDDSTADDGRMEQIRELEGEIDHYKNQADVLSKDNFRYETNAVSLQENNRKLNLTCVELEARVEQLQDEIENIAEEDATLRNAFTQTLPEIKSIDHACDEIDGRNYDEGNHVKNVSRDNGRVSDISNEEKGYLPCSKKNTERLDLIAKVDGLQLVSLQRLGRIRLLERQLNAKPTSDDIPFDLPDAEVLKLDSDENLLRLSILRCELDAPSITNDAQTFIVIDLLNYESQASAIGIGREPSYQFDGSYKMKITLFMLEQMRCCGAIFEIYQLMGSSFQLLGHSVFYLNGLLDSTIGQYQRTVQLVSANSNAIIGSMEISANLLSPLRELREVALQDVEASTCPNEWTELNRLEIRIEKMKDLDLTSRLSEDAGIYIRYNVLGFQDTVTDDVSTDVAVIQGFQHTKIFPVRLTPGLMEIVKDSCIELSLYRGGAAGSEPYGDERREANDLVGKGTVSLEALTRDQDTSSRVKISSPKGATVGYVVLRMKWLQTCSRRLALA